MRPLSLVQSRVGLGTCMEIRGNQKRTNIDQCHQGKDRPVALDVFEHPLPHEHLVT